MKKISIEFVTVLLLATLTGCDNEWLETKSDQKLVSPTTVEDHQALLDNTYVFNVSESYLGEVSGDDFFCLDEQLASATEAQRRAYLWDKNLIETYSNTHFNDWANGYQKVFYANVAMEGLERLENLQHREDWRSCYGQALFWRGWALFHLAQLFCPPYNPLAANAGALGLPLPLESDINIQYKRASLEETYTQIKRDLVESLDFLPSHNTIKTRPSQIASLIMLSRLCLVTADYVNAALYAERALEINDRLLNYNLLTESDPFPFVTENEEVVLHANMYYLPNGVLAEARLRVDTTLYRSYDNEDRRRSLFFKPAPPYHTFKGMYTGNVQMFAGIGLDELYLNYFEAHARTSNIERIEERLTYWINNRYTADFVQPTLNNAVLLEFVMAERRKQLLFRGLRWVDLRRLNHIERAEIDVHRKVEETRHVLTANDKRYVFQIPSNVFTLNSDMVQNER